MDQNKKKGFALKNGEGLSQIHFRGTQISVKISKEDSDGKYTMFEMAHPPNVGPALHIHPHAAEAYYVLEGEYQVRCGKELYVGKRGDFIFIPKGIEHNYQSGPAGGRVLVISPAGLEKYFEEVAKILDAGPIAWESEQQIAKRYGQEFLESLKHWGH